jgi:hypothetical protein
VKKNSSAKKIFACEGLGTSCETRTQTVVGAVSFSKQT